MKSMCVLGFAAFMWVCSTPLHGQIATIDVDPTLPEVRALVERYREDRGSLHRTSDAPTWSMTGKSRLEQIEAWQQRLALISWEDLDRDSRIDVLLLDNLLRSERRSILHTRADAAEVELLLPFTQSIVGLHEARRRHAELDVVLAARRLAALAEMTESLTERLRKGEVTMPDGTEIPPTLGWRAARLTGEHRRSLRLWYEFHSRYMPEFNWWMDKPYEAAREALEAHERVLREAIAGVKPGDDPLIGDPVGREELLEMLQFEMVPYEPAELVEIAAREYAWCLAEMLAASRELGFGDDWHAALEHVKTLHVDPGDQPALIRDLAFEAIEFLETRELMTIPEQAKRSWRMRMMSPERQRVSPYFLGGETIIVSFPTDEMTHEEKLMSMRSNNIHFSRATVHHELIPGHHLQGYMTDRYRTHRNLFRTPFWVEGWALYWEMRLWDLGFPQSPEDRIGMLFWRMHRCARIVFSLGYHLGEMSAEEAVEYLVENVGHERSAAEAEVRRSIRGDYPPLYQAAYMLGGLQLRALHEELVESGEMTEREFHDAVLRQGPIPIELLRAALTDIPLERDFETTWRFYGQIGTE